MVTHLVCEFVVKTEEFVLKHMCAIGGYEG